MIAASTDHAGVYVPPPLIFAVPLFAAFLADRQRAWTLVYAAPAIVAVAGVGLIVAGAALGIAGVWVFRKSKTTVLPATRPTTTIVAAGPYRFTRNPMYLGMAFAYLGITLLLNTVWALLLFPIVIWIVTRYVIQREERYLAAKFGDAYAEYRRRVRRWL